MEDMKVMSKSEAMDLNGNGQWCLGIHLLAVIGTKSTTLKINK